MPFIAPSIPVPAADMAAAAAAHQNQLTKPPGSLGQLEDVAIWLAARQARVLPLPMAAAIAVFAGDHGVTAQGVAAFPSSVTAEMVRNFARGGAAINVLARTHGARLTIVNVGVASELETLDGVTNARVRAGTADFTQAPAMSRAEAIAAIEVGRAQARADIAAGANLLIAGEMGIGNTTATAALLAAFTGTTAADWVGAGAGVNAAGIERKRAVIDQALARAAANSPADVIDWLAEVGGLEIAAMAGYYLEGAAQGVPVLIDGFITTAAAIATVRIAPAARDWMLASHCSAERAHARALEELGLKPLLALGLRLGEGTGAAIALPVIASAIALHTEMATFAAAGVQGPV
ncbi:MAG: nicotinate-nucleotide--dimethylbenzimidazole phosphoribosyltransferase [Burkholderiaceae bacterium]